MATKNWFRIAKIWVRKANRWIWFGVNMVCRGKYGLHKGEIVWKTGCKMVNLIEKIMNMACINLKLACQNCLEVFKELNRKTKGGYLTNNRKIHDKPGKHGFYI